MKARFIHVVGLLGVLAGGGCGSLDVAPEREMPRIVSGTVRADRPLPAGAEVVVRVVDGGSRPSPRAAADLPLGDRALPAAGQERVMGEQIQRLPEATNEPVPFRVEFEADDPTLRRGLNLEVRISVGGRVHFRNLSAHVVTLAASAFPQAIAVQAVER